MVSLRRLHGAADGCQGRCRERGKPLAGEEACQYCFLFMPFDPPQAYMLFYQRRSLTNDLGFLPKEIQAKLGKKLGPDAKKLVADSKRFDQSGCNVS